MSQQSSNKEGVRSHAKKEDAGRNPYEQQPDAAPVAGAFDHKDEQQMRDDNPLRDLESRERYHHRGTHTTYEDQTKEENRDE